MPERRFRKKSKQKRKREHGKKMNCSYDRSPRRRGMQKAPSFQKERHRKVIPWARKGTARTGCKNSKKNSTDEGRKGSPLG